MAARHVAVRLLPPDGLAPMEHLDACADPDTLAGSADVSLALEARALCLECRAADEPRVGASDPVAVRALGTAQSLASMSMQYLEAW